MKIIVRSSVAALTALAVVVLAPAGSASAATTTVDNATAGRFAASTNWGTSAWSGPAVRRRLPVRHPVHRRQRRRLVQGVHRRVRRPPGGGLVPGRPGLQQRHTRSSWPRPAATSSVVVDQRGNGGRWVSLGTFDLAAGDYNVVGVSRWTNRHRLRRRRRRPHHVLDRRFGLLAAAGEERVAAQRVRRPAPRLSRDRPAGRHRHPRATPCAPARWPSSTTARAAGAST